MFDLRKAQKLSWDVVNQYSYISIMRSIKWNDIYQSEEELIDDLKKVVISEEPINISPPLYSGYGYIHSFAKSIQSGNSLTEKQLRQAKRLALQIKRAAVISDCY